MGSIKDAFSVTCKFDQVDIIETKAWTCVNASKYEYSITEDCPDSATSFKDCVKVSVGAD